MKQFAYYSGIVMFVIYMAMGLALLFTNAFATQLGTYRPVVGVGIIIYSIFRIWTTIRLFKTKKDSTLQ